MRKESNMKKVKLTTLLRLNLCQSCPTSIKEKNHNKLMCNWENSPLKPCEKVENCGNFPDSWGNEQLDSIKIAVD